MNLSFQAHFKEIFIGVPWRPRHGGEREKKKQTQPSTAKGKKSHGFKCWSPCKGMEGALPSLSSTFEPVSLKSEPVRADLM